MRKFIKKSICVFLAVLLCTGIVLPKVSATETGEAEPNATVLESGSIGDSAKYTLYSDGSLTISGTGEVECYAGNAPWTYSHRNDVKSVTVKSGITLLPNGLFEDHENLESVVIADSVTSIGDLIFNRCTSLTSVDLGKGLKRMGISAFDSCSALETITLPATLEFVGGRGPFHQCSNLREVKVASGNKNYVSVDSVLFTKDKKTLITYPARKPGSSYTVPSTVTTLWPEAFSEVASLTEITLPEGLEEICDEVFMEASIQKIYIPASVKEIGRAPFASMPFLNDITVDPANEYYTSIDGVLFDKDVTELIQYPRRKTDLIYYNIPSTVKTIGTMAFSYVHWPEGITLPDGLTTIRQHGFDFTACVEEFRIPASLKTVGYCSFDLNLHLERVYYAGTESQWNNISIDSGNSYLTKAERIYGEPGLTIKSIASDDTGKPILSWTSVKGASKYKLSYSTSENGTYSSLKTLTGTHFEHSGAKLGKTYYYKVSALNSSGSVLETSEPVSCLCLPAAPASFKAETVSSTGYPKLTWTAVDGAVKYEIKVSEKIRTGYTVLTEATGTSYTHKSAKPGTTYYYQIRPIDADGNMNDGVHIAVGECKPAKVSLSSVKNAEGGMEITWTKVSGISGYQIYRKSSSESSYTKIASVSSSKLTYTDSTAKAGTTYSYKVRAYAKGTYATMYGAFSAVETLPRVESPTITLSNTANGVTVKWAKKEGVTIYQIYRKTPSESKYTKLKNVSSSVTSFTDTDVLNNTTYYYRIRAYYKAPDGTITLAAYSPVKAIRHLDRAEISAVTIQTGLVKLTWKKVEGATGYQV
ncbi:MAG: leucine-rich repeat protein, partial [Erysipelotrichales bacterium]|nr:leucine-rich repeat protein [Erysipelotrichales bacterium]